MKPRPAIHLAPVAVAIAACLGLSSASSRQVSEPSAYAPGWSAVHADAKNSDYHRQPGPTDIELAWSRKFEGMINLGPTSDGKGRLFLTTSGRGCRLHALDRTSGKTLWCSDIPGPLAVSSAPLLDRQGRLYVGDGTAMRSFDRDGRQLWSHPIIGTPLSAQFTPAGDLIFITHVGVIYILDRDTGRDRMPPYPLVPDPKFDPAEGARACMRGLPECPSANTPAIDPATGRFYFTFWTPGAPSAGVRAMRVTAGPSPQVIAEWTNDNIARGSASSPDLSADGRRLYVTDNEGNLHALDTRTGKPIWTYDIGYASDGSVSLSPQGLIIPAGGRQASLVAIRDMGTHSALVWHDALRNVGIATQAANYRAYPTVAKGSGAADILVIDTRNGAILDREPIKGRPIFTVGTTVDLDGTLYVPTIGGDLHAYRAAR